MLGKTDRRSLLKSMLSGAAVAGISGILSSFKNSESFSYIQKNNINHSVCRWCFNDIPIETFCASIKTMGLKGIDLVGPKDWDMLKKYGLQSTMCNGAEISTAIGWNDPEKHDYLVDNYLEMIPLVAKAGFNNLICFSGNRNGKDDETGLANCAKGLKQILSAAEKNSVVITMELLNSKVEHKDYQCDRIGWATALAKELGSPNFKLLFDIYHAQINEGDIIRTIENNSQYISHYHVAGVPGRHEPDDNQELNYPAIMNAILKTGFTGYVAQEYIVTGKDKLKSLRKSVELCDV
jgi:hydroxypyruvate isomerase